MEKRNHTTRKQGWYTTQKIIPITSACEHKNRLGTRNAPAAATAMLYISLQEYLEAVSHSNSCVSCIEIAAAQELL